MLTNKSNTRAEKDGRARECNNFFKKESKRTCTRCNTDDNHPTVTYHHTFPLTSCQMYQ